jgi:hypothetical protein
MGKRLRDKAGQWPRRLGVWLLAMLPVAPAFADALVQSQAMKASTIVQYYIEDRQVRVEAEIGLPSLPAFRNLMPDAIYREMGFGDEALQQRLQRFFQQDLALLVEGEPLAGYVAAIGPSRRVLRDPINGTPLPVQDQAPEVIRAELVYPFAAGARPDTLVFVAPGASDIGFVAYHKGVAVNDFRYLASGYTLALDWVDPWYSSFDTRNLQRQYSAPMSGFIYVENFEVRKEIIARPKDLQRWVDLGLQGRDDIPVALQAGIRQKIGEFLSQHHPVTIDGEPVAGILESVNFLERTLTSSRVIDPPETLSLDSAIVGAIFVFPRSGLPREVVMDWDLWGERIQRIPVSAVDQAGPLPGYLEPDWRELRWTNYLKNPVIPTLAAVEAPAPVWRQWLARLFPFALLLSLAALGALLVSLVRRKPLTWPAIATALFASTSAAAWQLGASNEPDPSRAEAIVGDLLHNVYRAFDYREEGDIYDVLAQSVSGELLTDIYLETKRGLVLANQGGAQARVKDIALASVIVVPDPADDSFSVEAGWTVHGSVGHWGHVHQRNNRYLARLRVVVDGERWKLREMSVLQEERL